MDPTLDIVMPFYGDPGQFRDAVDSVRAQDDPSWRLHVLDDAYPDPEPGRWLLGLRDERISYRRHRENLGINANFSESLRTGDAEWITILGCDDRLLPGYVARVKTLATQVPDAAMLHPGVRVIDDEGREILPLVDRAKRLYRGPLRERRVLGGEELATSVTRGNWMYFPAVAWRREAATRPGFRPDLDVAQDLALVLDVARDGGTLVVDPEIHFEYRRHAASVSSWRASDGTRFVEESRFFAELVEEFTQEGWHRAARAARGHLSSRVNALTRLPHALRAGDGHAMRLLAGYALGRAPRR